MNNNVFWIVASVFTTIFLQHSSVRFQESEIHSYGLALPKQSLVLRSNIESRVHKILVVEGQFVRKGDVLIELSGKSAIAKKRIAELAAKEKGALMQANAELKYAAEKLRRMKLLYSKNAINQGELRDAELRHESAEAKLQVETEQAIAKQARFELAVAELEEYTICAPFDGQVSAVMTHIGDSVTSSTDLMQLISSNSLKAELYVPAREAEKFRTNEIVELKIHGPFENSICEATVLFCSPIIEATTGSIRVIFENDNSEMKLPAGVTVSLN